jgi:hypothetical protein
MDEITLTEKLKHAARVKEQRIQSGCDPLIAGWQNFIEEIFIKMEDYLVPGSLITFQKVEPEEKELFQELHTQLNLPEAVCSVFIPPSVLKNMMAPQRVDLGSNIMIHLPGKPSDAGIILLSRCKEYHIILNCLLALPPFTPGIDIYEDGQLLAGYSYKTIEECKHELPKVIWTYFK